MPFGELPLLSDEQFEHVFGGTINGLNHVLGSTFVTGKDGFSGPIGQMIRQVLSYHRSGERYARDWEAFRIGLLAMELHELRSTRPEVVAGLRRAIRRATLNEYFGVRFEVEIAFLLHRGNVTFTKSESPDFEITLADGELIFLECCSTNVGRPKENLTYKITSALTRKSKKPYANEKTALFIDFTNILHNSIRTPTPIDHQDLQRELSHAASQSPFGAVAAFALVNDLDSKGWALGCAAIAFGTATAPALSSFLNIYFPRGEHFLRHGIPFGI